MWRDALLVAGKDLRIELRSRVLTGQVLPFAAVVLVVFAFALGPDRRTLSGGAPGLFWVAVLLSSVLAVHRSVSVESAGDTRDALRLAGLDPAGVFLGKTFALVAELLVLGVLLGLGTAALYGSHVRHPVDLVTAGVAGIVGIAATGSLYGALVAGHRARETLLPFLLLPVVAPVVLSGTRAWQYALGTVTDPAAPWIRLLLVFAALYLALGAVIFGPLQEST